MDSIISELITSQRAFISTDMMGAYVRLAWMDLEKLYSLIFQEQSDDQQVLNVVETVLSYGYIYKNLSDKEYNKLYNQITKCKYEKLKELLFLYNELATILTDGLMTKSVISKYGLLDETINLSHSRDNALERIIYSSLPVQFNNIKNKLRKLYNNISIYKQFNSADKFDEIIVPKVSGYVRDGYMVSGINMLYDYILGKCEVKAGIDDKIKSSYKVVDYYVRIIGNQESNNYIRFASNADEMIRRYGKTKKLLQKKY